MKKYNTKPIDFTGCHPMIAEHLRLGEVIWCAVWDCREKLPVDHCGRVWISSYQNGALHPYVDTNDTQWKHAEPILKFKRIMPPERAVRVLIENGWKYNAYGQLQHEESLQRISTYFYQFMGAPLYVARAHDLYFPNCIIEEVEYNK